MTGIILIIIGLIISTIDIPILTLSAYPEYTIIYNDDGLGEVIQEYVVKNMLGGSLKLDILPDIIAYIMIAIGVGMLLKYNIRLLKVYVPLIITAGLSIFMKFIPFIFDGKNLVVYALTLSFILLIAEMYMEHSLIYKIADTTSELPNERDIVLMKFGWVGSALCRAFLYFIVLVGLADWIIIIYSVIQVGFMVFCIDRMYRCRYYLKKCQ